MNRRRFLAGAGAGAAFAVGARPEGAVAASGGLLVTLLTPIRVYDSRDPSGLLGGRKVVVIESRAGLLGVVLQRVFVVAGAVLGAQGGIVGSQGAEHQRHGGQREKVAGFRREGAVMGCGWAFLNSS